MSSYKTTIIITGASTGLGYEAAKVIAKDRPKDLIIVTSRNAADTAADTINKHNSQNNVQHMRLDLADLDDVRYFAEEVCKTTPRISALVLNAGLQVLNLSYTAADLETTFGVNHVGHALVFHLLRPHFAPNLRVVVTSSGTHDPAQQTGLPDAKYVTAELLAHPDEESKQYDGRQRYATSKLCNVLWTYALERRRVENGVSISVNSFDPGLMPGTGLARDASPILRFIWHRILPRMLPVLRVLMTPNIHTATESGVALARLAISPDLDGVSGKYFEGLHAIESSKDSYDTAKQDDLWEWTAEYLGGDKAEVEVYKHLA